MLGTPFPRIRSHQPYTPLDGGLTYAEKQPHYLKANALAQSLHKAFYEKNPGFHQALQKHGLKFKPLEKFGPTDMEKRSKLYSNLAALIWSPDRLLSEVVTQRWTTVQI